MTPSSTDARTSLSLLFLDWCFCHLTTKFFFNSFHFSYTNSDSVLLNPFLNSVLNITHSYYYIINNHLDLYSTHTCSTCFSSRLCCYSYTAWHDCVTSNSSSRFVFKLYLSFIVPCLLSSTICPLVFPHLVDYLVLPWCVSPVSPVSSHLCVFQNHVLNRLKMTLLISWGEKLFCNTNKLQLEMRKVSKKVSIKCNQIIEQYTKAAKTDWWHSCWRMNWMWHMEQ